VGLSFGIEDLSGLRSVWHSLFPGIFTFTYATCCIIAVPAAFLIDRFEWTSFLRNHSLLKKALQDSEPYYKIVSSLLPASGHCDNHDPKEMNLSIIHLNGGKTYIGYLLSATQDPNNDDPHIQFAPVVSGARREFEEEINDKLTKVTRLVIDTDYRLNLDRVDTSEELITITFPYREFKSWGRFDEELHKQCLKRGTTIGAIQKIPTSTAP